MIHNCSISAIPARHPHSPLLSSSLVSGPPKVKYQGVQCPHCSETVACSRFAPHLSRCMGHSSARGSSRRCGHSHNKFFKQIFSNKPSTRPNTWISSEYPRTGWLQPMQRNSGEQENLNLRHFLDFQASGQGGVRAICFRCRNHNHFDIMNRLLI